MRILNDRLSCCLRRHHHLPWHRGTMGCSFSPTMDKIRTSKNLDEFQCIRTAGDMTGFNPMATATATTAPPPTQGWRCARRGPRCAALGAATGAVRRGGSASSGAATGAAAGGLMGGMRRADSGAQQQQWAQQEAANYQRNRNEWNRAFSACMRSRGYTVG